MKQRAIVIFSLLAEVEGKVHGMPPEDVSFHELGGWDSIADMVGRRVLVDALPGRDLVGVPRCRGPRADQDRHGLLPVPTPAASLLLQGYEFVDDGLAGRARDAHRGGDSQASERCHSPHSGYRVACCAAASGFGTKVFRGISNVLRVLAFEEPGRMGPTESRRSPSKWTIRPPRIWPSHWIIFAPIRPSWTCCRCLPSARKAG